MKKLCDTISLKTHSDEDGLFTKLTFITHFSLSSGNWSCSSVNANGILCERKAYVIAIGTVS